MILTLDVTGPLAASLGTASRQVFSTTGGVIGRAKTSDWVLPNSKVSSRHAIISFLDGVFYIEDTSTNGVFINSPGERLTPGLRYALQSGDRILIESYEIHVSVGSGREAAQAPFETDDPFAPAPPARPSPRQARPRDEVLPEPVGGEEVDPLKLLDGGQPKREPLRKAPTAEELDRHSPLSGHYQPPAVLAPPAAAQPPHQDVIPADYDPLCDDFTGRAAAPQTPVVPDRRSIDVPRSQPASLRSPVEPVRAAPSVQDRPSPVPEARLSARETPGEAPTLNELLAGAGLDRVQPTADLARSIGEIFRVVVSGVMDVLQSRQQVKDEFHLPLTRFRPADNNPLKFSANVDDALHNLLVKRNPGYLGPVEAFEDAFDDLRNHQLAVLAGMRVAFESLLAEFDPDRLEKEFDQVKRAPLVGARRRYWDLYRERRDEIAKDPDASFKRLFGEQFARAYEAQLNRLKAERRGRGIVQQGKGAQSSGGR